MDFRNKKKVEELERDLRDKDNFITELQKKLNIAEKKLRGDRVCDGYCENCVHGIKKVAYSYLGYACKTWQCDLDCKRQVGLSEATNLLYLDDCKDFERKNTDGK